MTDEPITAFDRILAALIVAILRYWILIAVFGIGVSIIMLVVGD